MGHSIVYIIDVPGLELNKHLDDCDKASETDIRLFSKEQALWEGGFPGSIDFAFTLFGNLTVAKIPIKYQLFSSGHGETVNLVVDWESRIKSLFPDKCLIRMHESVYDELVAQQGWDWFVSTDINKIKNWINDKDKEYWAYV